MRLEGQWHISVTAPGFVQWSVGVPAFIRGGRKATDKQEKGGRKAGDRQEKGERRGKKSAPRLGGTFLYAQQANLVFSVLSTQRDGQL